MSAKCQVRSVRWAAALVAAVSVWCLPARADLTATVIPGYTFGDLGTDRPTAAKLNLLGMPIVIITGTIGGTNASIAAGSINGTHFADSVVDNRTVEFTNSSPRAIQIKASGVNVGELSTNVAGLGLGGGAGSALSNKVDGTFLAIIGDVMTVTSNLTPRQILMTAGNLLGGFGTTATNITLGTGLAIHGGALVLSNFTSIEYSVAAGAIANTNHSLGTTPRRVFWVMVCKTADVGFVPGDEEPASSFYRDASGTSIFAAGANATNVYAAMRTSTPIHVVRKDTGASDSITDSRWRLKCYAFP